MKISDREAFEKINVFGTGAENTAFAGILPAIPISIP